MAKQLSLFGLARKRARAKRHPSVGVRPHVPHRARPEHKARHPVHVTIRARRLLPSFRKQAVLQMFVRLLTQRPRADFQVVHYSVQKDHLHLIVEAKAADVLARALKYVFDNWKKHGHASREVSELDAFSSAVSFHRATAPEARTWLLAYGWQKGGWLAHAPS